MSEQPSIHAAKLPPPPPTGVMSAMWTVRIKQILSENRITYDERIQMLSDEINAALSAEQWISKEWYDAWGEEKLRCEKLEKQLATERKDRDDLAHRLNAAQESRRLLVDALEAIKADSHPESWQHIQASNALAKMKEGK